MIPQNQRSREWHKFRNERVGSSDASAIMGCGFLSIGELFDIKLGLRKPEEDNAAMARGNALEDEARAAFEAETGLVVFPMVCVSKDYPWMIASMDGMTIEKDVAVEIKCPGWKTHQKTVKEGVPEYYIPQLQHQMAITGLQVIYYFSYYRLNDLFQPETLLIKIARDDAYIAKLIEREKQFMKLLDDGWRTIKYYEDTLDTLKDEVYKILEDKNE